MAVELAMVVLGEAGLRAELAGQQPAGQRHAHDHRHAAPLGLAEEQFGRTQAEHVVDDLHAGHARELDGLERFLHAFDADPVARDLAALDQAIEALEDLRAVIGVGGRAMQLQQVQGVHLQVAQAAVDPVLQVGGAVAFHGLRGQPASGLGRDEGTIAPALAQHPGDQPLRVAIAVDIGGVDEIQPGIQRRMQRGHRFGIVHLAPGGADRPGSEADLADAAAAAAKGSGTHHRRCCSREAMGCTG